MTMVGKRVSGSQKGKMKIKSDSTSLGRTKYQELCSHKKLITLGAVYTKRGTGLTGPQILIVILP